MKPARTVTRLSVPVLFVSILALAGTACPGGTGPSAGGKSPLTLTVNPPDATGRRNASVRIDPPAAMTAAQLSFELPADCRITAGAAVRPIETLTVDKPVQQELAFECPAGTTGVLKATLTAKDAGAKDFTSTVDAKL
jgi:hypothetical protein